LTVNVPDSQAAADALVKKTEELGGHFADRRDTSLRLKVPVARAPELLRFAETLGPVLQRSRKAEDLRARLREQRTRVKSKEKMLEQYLKVLSSAKPQAVVTVERQVTQLVQEIESLKGSNRMLEHRLQLAQVNISFRIKKARVPRADGSSPFPWLNTVNLSDLYRDFTHVPD
jgi:chromosome segregation ATPase